MSFKCDLCGKKTTTLRTVVLYKKSIDYCPNCERKIKKLLEEFRGEMRVRYLKYEKSIKELEEEFLEKKNIFKGEEDDKGRIN